MIPVPEQIITSEKFLDHPASLSMEQSTINNSSEEEQNTTELRPLCSSRFTGKFSASLSYEFLTLSDNLTTFHLKFQSSIHKNKKIHQKDLSPLPRAWSDLKTHLSGKESITAG